MATGVTDFSFGFTDTPSFYKGATARLATSSGLGSQTAVGVRVVLRTATGSGVGTESATYLEVLPRTATGSGGATAGSTAVGLLVSIRTATGNGLGSSSAVFFAGKPRTATGSGIGESTSAHRRELFRQATGSGTGTEIAFGTKVYRVSATGSGSGGQSPASFNKLFIFRPPTDPFVRWADFGGYGIANRLFSHVVPGERGRNVYKLTDESFTENEQRDLSNVQTIYYGGSENIVTQSEKDDLISAGYGEYVT
jgi:hypothetical protein